MMSNKQHLYRGKRIDNDEWIEGNLILYPNGKARICITTDKEPVYGSLHWVIPETVGQYTNLRDKNGEKIFEGDIIEFEDCGGYGDDVYDLINAAEVAFCNGRFKFGKMRYDDDETSSYDAMCGDHDEMIDYFKNSIIIGNIYDDPVLLEV